MESPNRQAVKLLREQRKRKKRIAAFLCMAGVVVVGTVMALRMSGRAMNNMALDCVLTHDLPHQHSEACYYTPPEEGAQKVLVCGMADFVVHKHDPETCFDKSGNLVCMLPEIEEHTHTEECYQNQQVLSCGMQEGEGGHVHSDSCYGPDYSAEPTCGLEESEGHTHGEDCYDDEGKLICELEENEGHTHDGSCYPKVLVCGFEEGDGGHVHSDACYSTEAILTCGKNEVHLHTHTEECYLHTVDQPDQLQAQELAEMGIDVSQMTFNSSGEAPEENNRVLSADGRPVLKCGQMQVAEHVHGDGCFISVGPEGSMIAGLESGGEDAEMPGQRTAVYQDSGIRATAIYNGADFPENARVSVERVDESEGLPGKQEELSGMLQDEELQLKALLKVTVSMPDGNYELSEPVRLIVEPAGKGEVTAAAWYDSSVSDGEQTFFTQSVKSAPELLEVTVLEEGGVEAGVSPGAVIGIAQRPASEDNSAVNSGSDDNNSSNNNDTDSDRPESTAKPAAGTVVSISQDFEYEDEDYSMVFHIDGIARPKTGAAVDAGQPEEDALEDTVPESTPEPAAEPTAEPEGESGAEDGETSAPAADTEPGADDGSGGEELYFSAQAQTEDDADENSAAEPDGTEKPEPTPDPEPEPSAWPEEETAGTATVTVAGVDALPANVLDDPEHPLGLKVERVPEESAVFGMYADNVKIDNTENDLPDMKVMSYALYYKGMELDMSQCTVNLEVKARPRLLRTAAKITDGQSAGAGEQEAPVAIAVMTTGSGVQENDPDAGEKVFTAQNNGQQATAPIADQQTQADELISSCIDSSLDCSYAAAPLDENNGSVALTLQGSAANSSVMTIYDSNVPLAANEVYETEDAEDESFAEDTEAVDDGEDSSDVKAPDGRSGEGDDETIIFYDGENTFVVVATTAHNPSFNVEYYAVLDKVKEYTEGEIENFPTNEKNQNEKDKAIKRLGYLPVIDTRKEKSGELPQNGKTPQITYLKVEGTNIETEKRLTQIYDTMTNQTYFKRPSLPYFMPGDDVEKSYDLKQIWVTRKGEETPEIYGNVDVTDKDGTHMPTHNSTAAADIAFTNRDDLRNKPGYIYVSDDCTIKLIFVPKDNSFKVDTNFYDYDITDGKEGDGKYWVNEKWGHGKGINSDDNYEKNDEGEVVGTRYAFGNGDSSVKTGLGDILWGSNELNKRNDKGGGYQGCTFGLVTGGNEETVTFANGIAAPKLFGQDEAKGKIRYAGEKGKNELGFIQYGDTYTLDFAKVSGNEIGNLSGLGNVGNYAHIWTNNFWPMDKVRANAKDPKYGHERPQYYYKYEDSNKNEKTGDTLFNLSDDGQDRNSFFGMNFSVNFTLTKDYTGPLEYLFFGDDDMWVFLDGELVCDIGGVHSSVGEIVNLWDYVSRPTGDEKVTHRLDFFYTERGAYGSTCWMQYTLPSVQAVGQALTSGKYGSLRFEKLVNNQIMDGGLSGENGKSGYDNTEETFLFSIKLTNSAGEPLSSGFRYLKYDEEGNLQKIPIYKDDGNIDESQDNGLITGGGVGGNESEEGEGKGPALYNGAYFTLKKGEYIEVPSLPRGTKFIITEEGVLKEGQQPVYDEEKKQWEYTTKAKSDQEHQYDYFVDGEKISSNVYEGTIPTDETVDAKVDVKFANTYYSFELPETGGTGTWMFTGAGALMLLAAGCLVMRKRTNKN